MGKKIKIDDREQERYMKGFDKVWEEVQKQKKTGSDTNGRKRGKTKERTVDGK